jgi:phosphoribosylanthranilate isomerase
MKIKVCGTQPEQIQEIDALGVDYIGLIFYHKSKRDFVGGQLPKTHAQKVGVFVNESPDSIHEHMQQYGMDIIQLHGEEPVEDILALREMGYKQIWKACPIRDEQDIEVALKYNVIADRVLVDTKGVLKGGNGFSFDWKLLEMWKGKAPMLAGGIGEGMEGDIQEIRDLVYGIDLNSKFEIEPGVKDIEKVKKFIANVR